MPSVITSIMDSKDGFDNNQAKPLMYYSDLLHRSTPNQNSNLLVQGKEDMMQSVPQDKTHKTSTKSFPQASQGQLEPFEQGLSQNFDSGPMSSYVSSSGVSHPVFYESTGNMQVAYPSTPLRKMEPFTGNPQENFLLPQTPSSCYDSGFTQTFPRYQDSGFSGMLPLQKSNDSGLARTLPRQQGSGLGEVQPMQNNYYSVLAPIPPIKNPYDSGLTKTLQNQIPDNKGLFQVPKLNFQHFNHVQTSPQGLRGDYCPPGLPGQYFQNEVQLPAFDQCAKLGTGGNFQEVPLPLSQKNPLTTAIIEGTSHFQQEMDIANVLKKINDSQLSQEDPLHPQLSQHNTEQHSLIEPINNLKDPVNVFVAGPKDSGKYILLKYFLKNHTDCNNYYNYNKGLTAWFRATNGEILTRFSTIKNLCDCLKVLDRIYRKAKCVLVLVYSLTVSSGLLETEEFIKNSKQYFIESRVPIVLVGNTLEEKIPTGEASSSSYALSNYKDVKGFFKCSATTGENVCEMFSFAIEKARKV